MAIPAVPCAVNGASRSRLVRAWHRLGHWTESAGVLLSGSFAGRAVAALGEQAVAAAVVAVASAAAVDIAC